MVEYPKKKKEDDVGPQGITGKKIGSKHWLIAQHVFGMSTSVDKKTKFQGSKVT